MSFNQVESSEQLETSTPHIPEKGVPVTQGMMAWLDLKNGLVAWRIWLMLAYQDISLRYRRSILGPLWITLSMAITVYSMGYLYSNLFKIDMPHYFPFLASGMLTWSLISTLILESTDGFISAQAVLKEIKFPYSLHIHRLITRNMIIFFHNILVMIPIYMIFHAAIKINLCTLLLIPGLMVIYFNFLFYGTLLAIIGARYRDIGQVIKSLVQVVFFLTPIMWDPIVLHGQKQWIVDLNPFYAFIELIRQPLLGHMPSLSSVILVTIMTGLGIVMSSQFFIRYRSRIIYWL